MAAHQAPTSLGFSRQEHWSAWNNAICSNMDLEIILLSEVSHKEKDKYHIPHIIYMWNLKYHTNECIFKQKQTHRHREQIRGCQGEGVWGQWIENRVLPYRTKNYIQYPMIGHNILLDYCLSIVHIITSTNSKFPIHCPPHNLLPLATTSLFSMYGLPWWLRW